MSENKKKSKVGRPSIWNNSEQMEKSIKIWCSQFFEHLPIWEIAEKYDCSEITIKRAITFVNKHFVKIPNKELLNGSIFSVKERLKRLTLLLELELKKEEPSNRNIVELNREIREDSRDLLKLQNLYTEKYDIELSASGSIKEILEVLSRNKEKK